MNSKTENNESRIGTSVILISDLYRLRIAEAIEFQKMSKDRAITDGVEFIREHYLTKSWSCGSAATYLAHCVVQFGDVRLDSINFDNLRPTVEGISCEGQNPYLRGLDEIKQYLMDKNDLCETMV